jgi:hypothetical protein
MVLTKCPILKPTFVRVKKNWGSGNIAGSLLKNFNLGPVGNSIAGLVGGGLGGQLLSMMTSSGAATAAAGSGLDLSSILSGVGSGGLGGAIVMVDRGVN